MFLGENYIFSVHYAIGYVLRRCSHCLLSLSLEIQATPATIDNNLAHQGIVNRKYANEAITFFPPALSAEGGSGV